MNEKKLYTLTIDPEFRDLIPPLNEDEFAMLEESIISNGCESPLIAWNDVIVDGHNRYAVCQKHGIPFAVMEKNFASREDAMLWMLRNQLGRRNLNSYQRGELRLSLNLCSSQQRAAVRQPLPAGIVLSLRRILRKLEQREKPERSWASLPVSLMIPSRK